MASWDRSHPKSKVSSTRPTHARQRQSPLTSTPRQFLFLSTKHIRSTKTPAHRNLSNFPTVELVSRAYNSRARKPKMKPQLSPTFASIDLRRHCWVASS
ncbi:hypothetical protein COLO4_26516 [Corchorus olitorius]|uniref:Uncharacterized protein n=1 Tax=Corchorus olitorius TaxID=93759 RepID=A0A1R3HWL6_9ROSI|nr:hypothetical protein COLO4_26516 [Corchorus olitorius]